MGERVVIDRTSVEGLIGGAFRSGAVTDYKVGKAGGLAVTAAMHGKCENPIEVYRVVGAVAPNGQTETRVSEGRERKAVAVSLRCRKCSTCLYARGKYWEEAATREIALAYGRGCRTWFGTLTLTPEEQAKAAYAAMSAVGVEAFGAMTASEQMPLRHGAVSRSLTLALKRLRKRLGVNTFRYLLVCEAHKSGLPHYHALVHETSRDRPIRKSVLNDFWPLGFSQWRLAKPEAAKYTAKYLSKSAVARVRASVRYGSWTHDFSAFAQGSEATVKTSLDDNAWSGSDTILEDTDNGEA